MLGRGSAAHRFQPVPEVQLFISCTLTHRCSRHREPGSEWKGTALSLSGIPSLVCRHVCVPSVDQTHPKPDEDLFCYMKIPCPCSMPRHLCTLAMWPEPVFSCMIYVRIHLPLESMDQLCQHWMDAKYHQIKNHADTEMVEMKHKMTIWIGLWQSRGLWDRIDFYRGQLESKTGRDTS